METITDSGRGIDLKKLLAIPAWTAVVCAFVFGLLTHLFGFVTVSNNYDNITVQPYVSDYGAASGRFMLTVLENFSLKHFGGHNLHFFNGVVGLVLLAGAAGLIVSCFGIQSRKLAGLAGVLFVSFPAITAMMFFRYAVIYYSIAVFLAVLAVWILPRFRWLGLLLSALCTANALGIYQAYLPLTVALMVLELLRQALAEDVKWQDILTRGIYACISLALGLLLYFVFMKAALVHYQKELTSYMGIDSMGAFSLGELPGLLKEAVKGVLLLPKQDYCGIAQTLLLRRGYLVIGGLCAVLVVLILILRKKSIGVVCMTALLCAMLPVAINLIRIMSPESHQYTLMVMGFVAILFAPVVLIEALPPVKGSGKLCSRVICFCLIGALLVVGFCNIYMANVNYSAQYYINRQVENYVAGIVTQVRMTEGFTPEMKWVIVGNIEDPLLKNGWANSTRYGGNTATLTLLNSYSRNAWITNYIGYTVPSASEEHIAAIKASAAFAQMPCWPAEGSIRIIEDAVVIKFQDA